MLAEYVEINGQRIVIKGIGQSFYENGYPVCAGVDDAVNNGCTKVSMMHVADELLKNGFSPKAVVNKLKEEKSLDIQNNMDISGVEKFCHSSYEDQREQIFKYLFSDKLNASNWFRNKYFD